ncbi:MAG: hypothetical protein NTU88_10465 [Armatimonadetes bacterium]|nr:hypothetical protein [Armatimonadota bacterium]
MAYSYKPSVSYYQCARELHTENENELRIFAAERLRNIMPRLAGTAPGRDVAAALEIAEGHGDPHAWIGAVLRAVSSILNAYGPTPENWELRRQAFCLLDCPLHVAGGKAWQHEVAKFYSGFLDRMLQQIRTAQAEDGLLIWKLYNMGFVVKSKSCCVGFDINPKFLTSAQQASLASALDVQFISHPHSDHFNGGFIKLMLAKGKYVVMTPDALPQIAHHNLISMRDCRQLPIMFRAASSYSYAGVQGRTPCNVYVVVLDGYVVSHNGDNCDAALYSQIEQASKIDVQLCNCWAQMNEYIDATKPRIFITGHENELDHDVNGRAAYQHTYEQIDALDIVPPWKPEDPEPVIMTYGEGIFWSRIGRVASLSVAKRQLETDPSLGKGDIELTGRIVSVNRDDKALIVIVDQIRVANSEPIKLIPPRRKVVYYTDLPHGAQAGTSILVTGHDTGVGKPITAREIHIR